MSVVVANVPHPLTSSDTVSQGSVLVPILFIIYTAGLAPIVSEHGLLLHQYPDDSLIYGFCRPAATSTLSSDITECVNHVSGWMSSNRLQLNADKTEVMWCTSTPFCQLPSHPRSVAGANVYPVSVVRDLGVFIDSDLGAATHVRRTVSRCFGDLSQLRHLRPYVTDDCLRSLVLSVCQDSTMVTSLLGCQLICSDTFSLCSTLRLVWCSGFAAMTPSQMLSQRFTGCVYLNRMTSKSL